METTNFLSSYTDKEGLQHKTRPLPPKVQKGNILIPDISGFTNFVTQTDLTTGTIITQRLLSAIMEGNKLGLLISEIEGDALLLYKYGRKFTRPEILDQYERMLSQFETELALIGDELGIFPKLSLKLIAHYGSISEYRVLNFQKLYGDSIIEAHVLLKNSVKSNTYVLITNDLLEPGDTICHKDHFVPGKTACNLHGVTKELNYQVFDYTGVQPENKQFQPSLN